jgi:hypothetical protein
LAGETPDNTVSSHHRANLKSHKCFLCVHCHLMLCIISFVFTYVTTVVVFIYALICLYFFVDREAQRRENGANGGNASGEGEPSVRQNQQQAVNSDAMRQVLPLQEVVSNTNTTSTQSEVRILPPGRGTPTSGVRVRPCPPPRRRRRCRTTSSSNEKTCAVPTENRTRDNWQDVGKELRKIADEFCASSLKVGE